MSSVEPVKRSRGRPKKAPEECIQDKKEYMKEYYAKNKEDNEYMNMRSSQNKQVVQRYRDVYKIIRQLVLDGEFENMTKEQIRQVESLILNKD